MGNWREASAAASPRWLLTAVGVQQQQPTSQPAAVSEAEPKPAAAYSAICTTGYHMRAAPEPSYPGSAVTTNQALGGYARVTTTGGSQGSGSSTGHGNGSFTNQGSGSGLDLGGDDEDYSYPGSPGRQPRRSSRRRTNRLNLTEDGELKPKNKVGRPIAYNGDPNSPHLTEHEKRRIKRRIANRESARRVRQKRQDVLEEMNIKMQQMQMHHMQLMRHLQESEQHKQVGSASDALLDIPDGFGSMELLGDPALCHMLA
ncbi:hypothetical protein WJX72_008393 [[Myrmecia] bisecta]|uniref:BZIP domain-containing protein n=1 Tax=[Myrmecia] bisecta TaxID=41462 RepID=A0AAW1NZF9_9CHLO